MSMVQPRSASCHRFVEQRPAAVHVGRVEDPGRELAPVERLAHQLEAARPVAHVQVHDAGLAAHQPADVRLGRDAQQLVQRRLARAMVADRHLADADDADRCARCRRARCR